MRKMALAVEEEGVKDGGLGTVQTAEARLAADKVADGGRHADTVMVHVGQGAGEESEDFEPGDSGEEESKHEGSDAEHDGLSARRPTRRRRGGLRP